MLRAKSPRESRIVGNPPVRFDEGEGSVRTLSTLLLVLEIFNICPLNPRNKFVRSKIGLILKC
jgi:hypothetical protein